MISASGNIKKMQFMTHLKGRCLGGRHLTWFCNRCFNSQEKKHIFCQTVNIWLYKVLWQNTLYLCGNLEK